MYKHLQLRIIHILFSKFFLFSDEEINFIISECEFFNKKL